jgi:hypothetical protein
MPRRHNSTEGIEMILLNNKGFEDLEIVGKIPLNSEGFETPRY